MKIHYSQNFTNGILGLGILNVAVGLGSYLTGSQTWMLLVIGGLIIGVGLVLRSQPYVVINDYSITRYAPIESMTRTYTIRSQDDIVLKAKGLYVRQDGDAIRIPITRAMIDPADWAALEAQYGRG